MTRATPLSSQTNSDAVNLAKGASVAFAGRVVGGAVQFLSQVVLARLLGPAAFGLYAIGWTVLRMGELLSTVGLDSGVIRFGSKFRNRDPFAWKTVLAGSLTAASITGCIAGGVLFVAAPWLATDVFQKPGLTQVFRLFSLALPLAAGLRVSAAATRVSQRMEFAVLAEDIARPILNLLLVLVFLMLGWGLLGATVAAVAAFGVAFIMALSFVRRLFSDALAAQRQPTLRLRELFGFSLTAALAFLSGMFIVWIDRLFIGYFRSATEVGIYQAVAQLPVVFALTLGAINAIFTPMIADFYNRGKMLQLEEMFKVSTKWALYLSMPVFLIICFSSREAITIAFGRQYADGATALVILSAAQLVNVGTGSVGQMLMMTGRQKAWLSISAFMLLTSVVLNLILVPRSGLTGAAVATSVAVSGLFIGGLIFVRRSLKMWPYDRRHLKGLTSSALTLAALSLLRSTLNGTPVVYLCCVSILSFVVFAGTLLLQGLDVEDKDFLRLILVRLKG